MTAWPTWPSKAASDAVFTIAPRSPSTSGSVCAIAVATLPQYTLPYMFETPVPSALRALILAGVSAKEHVPVSTIEPFVTFRGVWELVLFLVRRQVPVRRPAVERADRGDRGAGT